MKGLTSSPYNTSFHSQLERELPIEFVARIFWSVYSQCSFFTVRQFRELSTHPLMSITRLLFSDKMASPPFCYGIVTQSNVSFHFTSRFEHSGLINGKKPKFELSPVPRLAQTNTLASLTELEVFTRGRTSYPVEGWKLSTRREAAKFQFRHRLWTRFHVYCRKLYNFIEWIFTHENGTFAHWVLGRHYITVIFLSR